MSRGGSSWKSSPAKVKFAKRFHGLIRRRQFVVLGSPSAELRSILDGYGATYTSTMATLAAFDRR